MFFCLSRDPKSNFPNHHNLGRLVLSTDAGWHVSTLDQRTLIWKGYAETGMLRDLVDTVQDQQLMGNFCIFDHDRSTGCITIKSSRYRSFPVWYDEDMITNLIPLRDQIWADGSATIDQNLAIDHETIDLIGEIDASPIDRDHLIDAVHQRLQRRITQWLSHNDLPVRVYCSGGLDSMLVYSYVKQITDKFEMVFMDHVEYDYFWCKNNHHLKNTFWGYKQIHHWNTPTVLTSGAPGDEFMLRSPTTANLLLLEHGTSIMDQVSARGTDGCLHGHYFSRAKNLELFQQQISRHQPSANRDQLFWNLCNILVNDFQHWHLGLTLTFTPLRDLEIFKLFLRLPVDHAIDQIIDSGISRQLIEKNDPDLLDFLSDKKNHNETLSNLAGLIDRYSAVSGQ